MQWFRTITDKCVLRIVKLSFILKSALSGLVDLFVPVVNDSLSLQTHKVTLSLQGFPRDADGRRYVVAVLICLGRITCERLLPGSRYLKRTVVLQ